jgi:hypothetical protein
LQCSIDEVIRETDIIALGPNAGISFD